MGQFARKDLSKQSISTLLTVHIYCTVECRIEENFQQKFPHQKINIRFKNARFISITVEFLYEDDDIIMIHHVFHIKMNDRWFFAQLRELNTVKWKIYYEMVRFVNTNLNALFFGCVYFTLCLWKLSILMWCIIWTLCFLHNSSFRHLNMHENTKIAQFENSH